MKQSGPEREVRYCYQCGRRVNPDRPQCLFCNAYVHRAVRPPRACPFCGESVRHGAVKCPHCREFIGGKPPRQPTSQSVVVVDRSIAGTPTDMTLLPGQPVPPGVAGRLERDTVQAIEAGQPEQVSQKGVRLLSGSAEAEPEDGEIIDAQLEEPGEERKRLPGGSPREPAVPARSGRTGSRALARRAETPSAMVKFLGLGLQIGGALARGGRRLLGGRTQPDAGDIHEAEAEDYYRICEQCDTEIRATDHFCYHCGMQYHGEPPGRKKVARVEPINWTVYLAVLLFNGVTIYLRRARGSQPFPEADARIPNLDEFLIGVAVVLLLIDFLQRRRSFSQLIAIVLLILSLGVYLLA